MQLYITEFQSSPIRIVKIVVHALSKLSKLALGDLPSGSGRPWVSNLSCPAKNYIPKSA